MCHIPYIFIQLDDTRTITRCFCNCPAGASEKCKHVAALIHYINNEDSFSKTDFPQVWGKPSTVGEEKYKKGKKIEQLFPPIKKQKNEILSISHYDLVNTYNILSINCGVNKLIQEELLSEDDRECKMCLNEIIDSIEMEEIFMKNDRLMNSVVENQSSYDHSYVTQLIKFPLNKNEDNFYFNMVVVKKEEVKSIFNSTLEQSNSSKWTEHRKIRISATKCHKIKICKNMSAENQQKIVDIISNDMKLIGKAALNTAYGTQTEMTAIETYCEMFNKKTIKAGLIIHSKYPWLCASPDSLVLSETGEISKILEIKCPISCKNKHIVDEDTGTLNLKYLKYENGKVVLKPSHQYYTQCQILMFVSELNECDLFIYNTIDPLLITIKKNESFLKQVLFKVECFYFKYYLPKLSVL